MIFQRAFHVSEKISVDSVPAVLLPDILVRQGYPTSFMTLTCAVCGDDQHELNFFLGIYS